MPGQPINPRWWTEEYYEGRLLTEALGERDIAFVFRFLRSRGLSRSMIAGHTGLAETRVRAIANGTQIVTAYGVLERIAEGLAIPRSLMGLGTATAEELPVRPSTLGSGHSPAPVLLQWLARRAERNPEAVLRDIGRSVSNRPLGAALTPSRATIAAALLDYYRLDDASPLQPYRVALPDRELALSIVTKPSWVGLSAALGTAAEQAVLVPRTDPLTALDEAHYAAAVNRVAEISRRGTRIVDAPVYRLLSVDPHPDRLRCEFATTTFIEYALTMDLLEPELITNLAGPRRLPLRDRLLPDLARVADVANRICAGGVCTLFAAARPADGRRDRPDYALLVQQRSEQVLNAVGRLSVIPKAFHEPLTDLANDAKLSATLLREMEEELFGRTELDSADVEVKRLADPMHPSLLSEPLRWLVDRQDTEVWRMECVGVGLNLMSGNYEVACLTVIEDPTWWTRFGGMIQGNWEADGLRIYSSLDTDLLHELMADSAWSDEGLFACAEGLRRLRAIVTAPEGSP